MPGIIIMYYVCVTPDGRTGISVLRVSSEKLQRKIYQEGRKGTGPKDQG